MSQIQILDQRYSTLLKQAIGKYRQIADYSDGRNGRCAVAAIIEEMGISYRGRKWDRMKEEISETARQNGVCIHTLNITHPWSKIVPMLEKAGL